MRRSTFGASVTTLVLIAQFLPAAPAQADYIQGVNLDGLERMTLLGGLGHPWSMALNVEAGHIYWTDQPAGRIQRASLHGSRLADVFSDIGSADGVAPDTADDRIYWTAYHSGAISRADLDGSGVTTAEFLEETLIGKICALLRLPTPTAPTRFATRPFWEHTYRQPGLNVLRLPNTPISDFEARLFCRA